MKVGRFCLKLVHKVVMWTYVIAELPRARPKKPIKPRKFSYDVSVRTTKRTPSIQTLGVEEGRLEVSLMGDLRNAIFSRKNLSENKTHLCLLCQQTFRDVDLMFNIEFI